jgi:hypothetical protein
MLAGPKSGHGPSAAITIIGGLGGRCHPDASHSSPEFGGDVFVALVIGVPPSATLAGRIRRHNSCKRRI